MNDYSNQDEQPDEDDDAFSSPPSSTLRRGDDANLAVYRAALKSWSDLQIQHSLSLSSSSSSSEATENVSSLAAAQEAVNNATKLLLSRDEEESFLLDRLEAKISIHQQEGDDDDNNDNDDDDADEENDNDHVEQASPQRTTSRFIPVYVMVTSERLIFCAKEASDGATSDLDIAATRIDLHALSSIDPEQHSDGGPGNEISNDNNGNIIHEPAPVLTVYVQVQAVESGCGDDYNSPPPLEISIVPQGHDEAAVSQKCQEIFEAISKLVSLHPIDPNDNDDDNMNSGGGGLSAMMTMMMGGGADDNDEMIWAPNTATTTTLNGSDAAAADDDDERRAMLDRLDNLLVVPPELEVVDDDEDEDDSNYYGPGGNEETEIVPGQFDDADEEDEGDNDML